MLLANETRTRGSIRHDVWSFRAHLVGLLHRRCRLLLVHLVSLLLRTSTTVPCSEVDLSFTRSLPILPRRGAPHARDQCSRTAAPLPHPSLFPVLLLLPFLLPGSSSVSLFYKKNRSPAMTLSSPCQP